MTDETTSSFRPSGSVLTDVEEWALIFEHAEWGIALSDPQTQRLTMINPAFARMHGYTVEELTGRHLIDVIAPGSRSEAPSVLAHLRTAGHVSFESMHLRKNGSEFPVSVAASRARDRTGTHHYTIFNLKDITERKAADEAVRASEERFRAIFDALDQGIVLRDVDGRVQSWNRSAERILGLSAAEMAARHVPFSDAPEKPDEVPANETRPAGEALATGQSLTGVEIRIDRPYDTPAWITVSSHPLFAPGAERPNGVVSVFSDITAQREAEDALRSHEELLRRVFAVLPVGIWIVDGSGNILSGNEAGQRIWAGAKYVGIEHFHEYKAWWLATGERLAPEDWAVARLVRYGETSLNEELEIECFDGTHKIILNSAIPILDPDGRITGGIIVNHDVTEVYGARQLLEERVAERTREIRALLEVSRELASTLSLQPLLGKILVELGTVIPYTGAAICILEGDELVIADYAGPGDREAMLAVRLDIKQDSGFTRVVDSRAPLILDDVWEAPWLMDERRRLLEDVQSRASEAHSWLGVPLIAKGELIGVLRLDHEQAGFFDEQHARQALAFANHAAIAIVNARLYSQAQQAAALEERQRLARELHDSVSQAIYAVSLAVHTAKGLTPASEAALRQALDFALSLSQAALAEMRALIFELRPNALATDGVVVALQRLVEVLRTRHHLAVTIDLETEPPVDVKVKEALYRIAQEALTNIVKHARARAVHVSLRYAKGELCLRIVDDGQGFDPDRPYPGHLGLRSMAERAQRLDGDLLIESLPGGGTAVTLRLPA